MPVLGHNLEANPSKEDWPSSINLMCKHKRGGQGKPADFEQDIPRACKPDSRYRPDFFATDPGDSVMLI